MAWVSKNCLKSVWAAFGRPPEGGPTLWDTFWTFFGGFGGRVAGRVPGHFLDTFLDFPGDPVLAGPRDCKNNPTPTNLEHRLIVF